MAAAKTPSFDELLTNAGCSPDTIKYLKARGYVNAALLSKAGADDDAVIAKLVKPYAAGFTVSSVEHKAADPDMAEASILVACEDARAQRALDVVKASTIPGSAAPQAVTSAAGQVTAPSANAVPKAIDPGTLQALIDKWETAVAPRRKFPMHLLEGADATLARIHHEWTVSRQFTPLPLAEIIKSRAYNTDGSVNFKEENAKKDTLFSVHGGSIQVEEREIADKYLDGNRWTLWDAAEANGFALKLCGYGTDEAIDKLLDWLQKMIRDFAVSIREFNYIYMTLGYRIAFALRKGTKLEKIIEEVLADDSWLKEQKKHCSESAERRGKGETPRQNNQREKGNRNDDSEKPRDNQERKEKGSKGQKGASKDRLDVPKRSHSRDGSQTCKDFQNGRCKRAGKGSRPRGNQQICRFSHECWKCGKHCGKGAANCISGEKRKR